MIYFFSAITVCAIVQNAVCLEENDQYLIDYNSLNNPDINEEKIWNNYNQTEDVEEQNILDDLNTINLPQEELTSKLIHKPHNFSSGFFRELEVDRSSGIINNVKENLLHGDKVTGVTPFREKENNLKPLLFNKEIKRHKNQESETVAKGADSRNALLAKSRTDEIKRNVTGNYDLSIGGCSGAININAFVSTNNISSNQNVKNSKCTDGNINANVTSCIKNGSFYMKVEFWAGDLKGGFNISGVCNKCKNGKYSFDATKGLNYAYKFGNNTVIEKCGKGGAIEMFNVNGNIQNPKEQGGVGNYGSTGKRYTYAFDGENSNGSRRIEPGLTNGQTPSKIYLNTPSSPHAAVNFNGNEMVKAFST